MELEFNIIQKHYSISVRQKNENYQVKIGTQLLEMEVIHITPNCIMLTDEIGTQRIYIAATKQRTYVHINGHQYVIEHLVEKEKTSYREDDHLISADTGICAPMPGKILKILVQENQQVEPKQNLVIIEAMKMEHNIRAPKQGVVERINFKEGDLIDTGQEILEIDFLTENKKINKIGK